MTDAIYNLMAEIIQFQPAFNESYRSGCEFKDVTFKKSFGPWKKGYTTDTLVLNLEEMLLVESTWVDEYDECVTAVCELTLKPKETHDKPKLKRRKNS